MTDDYLHPWTPSQHSSRGYQVVVGQKLCGFRRFDEYRYEGLMWPLDDEQAEGLWKGPIDDWYNSHRFEWTEAVKKCGKKFGTVVQGGGAFGMYPFLLSKIFDTVYTFEPNRMSFSIMSLNLDLQDNVHRFEAALGGPEDQHVTTNLRRGGNYGEISTEMISEGINGIPTMAIDSLNLYDLDLIALDTEGDEIFALGGASYSIDAFRPVIVAELGDELILDYLRTIADYQIIGRSRSDTIFGIPIE